MNYIAEIQPTAADLLEAMACLIEENASLRQQLGKVTLSDRRISYTREELERGRSLCPQAFISPTSLLVVKLDS